MKNLLTIDKLSNYSRFLGKSADRASVASEVRQLAEAQLPNAIDAEISRRLKMLLDQDGIYRIRKLRLNFTVSRRDLSARKLSAVLARQLVGALEKQLSSTSDDVVYFDSEAEFFANLMADLLLGNNKDSWIYADYAALRDLSPIDAVVQLLLPRVSDLPHIAAGLQRRDALATLLRMLNENHARALLRAWSGQELEKQFRDDVIPALDQLSSCQEWLDAVSIRAIDKSVSLSLASLQHMLSCLGASTPLVETKVVLWAVLHRVFVDRYHCEISALLAAPLAAPSSSRSAAGNFSRLNADAIPIARDLLQWMGTADQRRDYIEQLLQRGTELNSSSQTDSRWSVAGGR